MAKCVENARTLVWHEIVTTAIREFNARAISAAPNLLARMAARACATSLKAFAELEKGMISALDYGLGTLPTLSMIHEWKEQVGIHGGASEPVISARIEMAGLYDAAIAYENYDAVLAQMVFHGGTNILDEQRKTKTQLNRIRSRQRHLRSQGVDESPFTALEVAEYKAFKADELQRSIDEEEAKKLVLLGTFDRAQNRFHVHSFEKARTRRSIASCNKRLDHFRSQHAYFVDSGIVPLNGRGPRVADVPLIVKLMVVDAFETLKRCREELLIVNQELRSYGAKCNADAVALRAAAESKNHRAHADAVAAGLSSLDHLDGAQAFLYRVELGKAVILVDRARDVKARADAAALIVLSELPGEFGNTPAESLWLEYLHYEQHIQHSSASSTTSASASAPELSISTSIPTMRSTGEVVNECVAAAGLYISQRNVELFAKGSDDWFGLCSSSVNPLFMEAATCDTSTIEYNAILSPEGVQIVVLPTEGPITLRWSGELQLPALPYTAHDNDVRYDVMRAPLDAAVSLKVQNA